MSKALHVLIVEDEMLLTMDLECIVEDSGHVVAAEAASLQEVLDLSDTLHPELAFVDINLADQSNGFDVAASIQARWPNTVIVYVTANISKIPEDFCGAHGAVAKPFSHKGLGSVLNYLAEGILVPPPKLALPRALLPSPILAKRVLATP